MTGHGVYIQEGIQEVMASIDIHFLKSKLKERFQELSYTSKFELKKLFMDQGFQWIESALLVQIDGISLCISSLKAS